MSAPTITERVTRLEDFRSLDKSACDERYEDVKSKVHKLGNVAAAKDKVLELEKKFTTQNDILVELQTSIKLVDKWLVRMGAVAAALCAGTFALCLAFYKPNDPNEQLQEQLIQSAQIIQQYEQSKKTDAASD